MSTRRLDVLGIGNAIVDVLAHTDDSFLARNGLTKGVMTLVDDARAAELYARMGVAIECSGGSAANTLAGLASLGCRAGYIGKVRDDTLGQVFRHDIRAAGVVYDTEPATAGAGTARCLIFVTPDAQRTMQTCLGASATLGPDDVDEATVRDARVTYLEGYLFDPPPAKAAFHKAARIAHASGNRVALTLSDPFCVDRHRRDFLDLLHDHVDILFANEAEALSLFEARSIERAVEALRGQCDVAVITRSANGSLVLTDHDVLEVPAEPVPHVVDTTGAGDLFASGFLFGLVTGRDLATCGRLGGVVAAEIIGHFGARPETDLGQLVAPLLSPRATR